MDSREVQANKSWHYTHALIQRVFGSTLSGRGTK